MDNITATSVRVPVEVALDPRRQAQVLADVERFDVVGFVMAYESGDLDEDETIEGFQHLIDSGLAWSLQGSYGRTAQALIEEGYCHDTSLTRTGPKPEKVGSHCECGAAYVYLERHGSWGYACAR